MNPTKNSYLKRTEVGNLLFNEFLVSASPGRSEQIDDLVRDSSADVVPHWVLSSPDLKFYCPDCLGDRYWEMVEPSEVNIGYEAVPIFALYLCRNCQEATKLFALMVQHNNPHSTHGTARKIGEEPPFGPHVEPRLLRLIQSDVDLFKKGLRAENQGLGIGAFSYYRRVIENQKDNLLRHILKAAQDLNAPEEIHKSLQAAIGNFKFSESLDKVKIALPPDLMIDGENPLLLLHGALSAGIHNSSDEECLIIASSIRHVLVDVADRIERAKKDKTGLKAAINNLKGAIRPTSPT